MTQRERQILRWIEENPMISQQELADKAGITRSSAAVHISNLMKKGHIAGKGYIVRTAPYAVVVLSLIHIWASPSTGLSLPIPLRKITAMVAPPVYGVCST